MKFYLRMRGGLGNQMFQFAYLYALLRENGIEISSSNYYLDIREYNFYKVRKFELKEMNLIPNISLINEGKLKYDNLIKCYRMYNKIRNVLIGKSSKKLNRLLTNSGYILGGISSPIPKCKLPDNVYLYGYFQSVGVIDKYKKDLENIFSLKDISRIKNKYLSLINDESLAISIRLGKDIQKNGWKVYDELYYLNAIKKIEDTYNFNQIIIFSDNIDYIKQNHWFENLNKSLVFIENCTPCEQLEIMKKCKHFIISNSTFSWWGAYLGSKKNSIIIAPRIWQDNVEITKTKLVLKNMIILDEE